MFTKRIGIDLGTANSLVWLAAPAPSLLRAGGLRPRAREERWCGVALALNVNRYVY